MGVTKALPTGSTTADSTCAAGNTITLFDLPPTAEPDRPIRRASSATRRPRQALMLPLGWRCTGCDNEVDLEGGLCSDCESDRRARAEEQWRMEIALRLELGEDAVEAMWYENDGDEPESTISWRSTSDTNFLSARAYDAWCEAHWRAWGLRRRWSGLPPEFPLERWVETWFFDRPFEDFDPEADVEVLGYPARSVIDVTTGPYL
jgi:hypothetical protein